MNFFNSIAGRITVALSALFLAALVVGGAGWWTSNFAFQALNTIVADRVVPLKDLKLISDKYAVDIVDASHKMRSGTFTWETGYKAVTEARKLIDDRWNAYMATYLTEEETALAATVNGSRKVSDKAVETLLTIIRAKDAAALDAFVKSDLYPAIDPTTDAVGKLVDLQVRVAQEVFATASTTFEIANAIVISAVIASLVAFGLALWLTRNSVLKPLSEITQAMKQLAGGNVEKAVPHLQKRDEIGAMALALDVFRANAIDRLRLERTTHQERNRERQRQSHIESVIVAFRTMMTKTVASVGAETSSMLGIAEKLTGVAQTASNEANSAGTASSGASSNVQTVAAAAEELSASIREIAGQAEQARTIVNRAAETAQSTDTNVSALATAADKVGTIVQLIRDIAEQTNLLALNATIEAARAGEMGRGFAVVASEVKTLASQTARATDEIATQIAGIQSSTRVAVDAIRSITTTVADISTVTTAIAAAVDEQETATREISKAIQSASDGTLQVARNVSTVNTAIDETAREAQSVQHASETLTGVARTLASSVEQFLHDVTKDLEDRRETLRVKLQEAVIVEGSGRRLNTTMLDLSETGCQIAGLDSVRMGDVVNVELPGGQVVAATVMHVRDGTCGLKFRERIENNPLLNLAA